jgi:hypothetical protein
MNNRERALAILNYRDYDRMPVVHFGFWEETLQKWRQGGHLTADEIVGVGDGNEKESAIATRLGFDFNWYTTYGAQTNLLPAFEPRVLEELPDGFRKVLDGEGAIVLQKDGTSGIPTRVDHLLKGRKEWEESYLPRLQFAEERIDRARLEVLKDDSNRDIPIGLHCGSLYGNMRNWLTMEGSVYLLADDEPLFDEMIDTVGELCYRCAEIILASGAKFDFGHFWEDICYKSGPLINPGVFERKVGPHYKRITDLLNSHGLHIVSLDCDGKIDALIPIWFGNGVNTMFPIEVGTWEASLAPWRQKYGPELRGVGGMNKVLFARDYVAIDAEVERLKALVDLGGFIPCPDHRIAPDAKWENVQYYCDRMRRVFG